MRIMLTSFGIEDAGIADAGRESVFHRMPPVSFRKVNEAFMPDYELLILCDQIVMDEASFQQLIESPARAYSGVSETFKALKEEGRIQLVDFPAILKSKGDLLGRMLKNDIGVLDRWVVPLRESLDLWRNFAQMSMQIWRDDAHRASPDSVLGTGRAAMYMHETLHRQAVLNLQMHSLMHNARNATANISMMVEIALDSSEKRKRKEYRSVLRGVVEAYLSYVNANLVLADALDIGFHDWLDFTPFYSTKFLFVGKQEEETQEERKQVERLFTVAFPELAIQDTRSLLKALNDKRIEDLRQLVSDAVDGKVTFDEHFAKAILSEVLRGEIKLGRFRNVLGYLTMPIGLVPWVGTPAEKLIEETVGSAVSKKIRKEHRWFYMLSEIAESRSKRLDQIEGNP